uniref:hypothetical protein n=1 Tax=Beijerinckia sp. L45 TaxID=1641855 RepID=UPI00131D81DE|nr:hypothetical protein [Beijerinckia sp. L45]
MILRNSFYAAAVAAGLLGLGFGNSVAAQTATGPLSQADVPDPAAKTASPKKPHPLKPKVAQAKAAKPKSPALEPWAAVDPGRVAPTPPPEPPAPPVDSKAAVAAESTSPTPSGRPDLAMKWSGNNDSASQTRSQNYGGDAEGAGAAMGLKFHF